MRHLSRRLFSEETRLTFGPWVGIDSDRKKSIDNPAADGNSNARLPQALHSTAFRKFRDYTVISTERSERRNLFERPNSICPIVVLFMKRRTSPSYAGLLRV
jgi:hypothetical protein